MKVVFSSIYVVLLCGIGMAQEVEDSLLIREASLNYIEGFYTNDFKRVESAIHPELAKRIIVKDTLGNYTLKNMGASELIYNTKKFKGNPKLVEDPFTARVFIFDISNNIATVKITQNKMNFIDYLHLAKINDVWKVINVLWTRID